MGKSKRWSGAAAVLVGVLLPPALFGQSYGTGEQILSVGAAAFHGVTGPGTIDGADGYLYVEDAANYAFVAPVPLPDGAAVTQVCVYAKNVAASDSLVLIPEAVRLVEAGQAPLAVHLTAVATTFHFGYGVVCASLDYTIHDVADLDGDQVPDIVAYRLYALFPPVRGPDIGLGGARITWHRQVSPKLGPATFPDVPTTHPFFQFVEALHAAGIAGGYGNGKFGVNDPVTRGQMAVFLSAALGLHWQQ